MITLREITPNNHLEVRALEVHPHQAKFVATVDKSLADAFVWKDALLRAAYEGELAVGFVLIYPFEKDGLTIVNIVRLLIGASFQGRGLGKRLMEESLNWIGTFSPDVIRISTLPENEVALSLYKSMGFIETGVEDGEIVLVMNKSRGS